MVIARKWVLATPFEGEVKETNFRLEEEELPEIKEGDFLCEAVYFSVDPYMRAYSSILRINKTMIGVQVAKIIESKVKQYPVDAYVVGDFGWRSHTVVQSGDTFNITPYIVPELTGHPLSLYLGVLGMPGNSAHFAINDCCPPAGGETVVITTAGGAVGSHVGQLAKLKGCKVIGITGSDEKIEWLKSIGFDHCINYKTETNMQKTLSEYASPNGIDWYFDNVGGELSSNIMGLMNENGRVVCCGCISSYNSDKNNLPKATIVQMSIIFKQLTVKGFHVMRYEKRWMEGINENTKLVLKNQLKYKESIVEGFENMPKAFIGMMDGNNIGKQIIKA